MMKDTNGVGGSGGNGVSSSSSTTTTTSRKQLQGATSSSSSNGAGAVLRPQGNIRKNSKPEDTQLLLRRLKQYLLYSKLRSLIPSSTQQQEQPFHIDHQFGGRHEEATEMEMELHEIPIAYRSDSDHDDQENIKVITVPKTNTNTGSNDEDHYDLLVLETKQEQKQDEDEDEDEDENDEEEEDGTCVTTITFESEDEEEKQPEKAFVPSVKIERMETTIVINTVVLKQKALTSSLFKILEEENLDIVFENQYRTEIKVCHTVQVRVVQPTATDDHHQYNVDRLEKRLQKWAKGEPEPML